MGDVQARRWTDGLRRSGYRPGAVLGSGVEGVVWDLGDGRVAKVWHRRTASELEALKTFYAAVARADVPFSTPEIHRILHLDGRSATVERRLPGRAMRTVAEDRRPVPHDGAVAAVIDVLAGPAAVEPAPGMEALPVLEGEAPFDASTPFARSLARLVERRVERFRGSLSARLRVDHVATAAVDALEALDDGRRSLVHGDLIPANILVDRASTPRAVLDFGFLSTVGDPAFDAAIAASIYDMYGPRAVETEAILDAASAERFGYAPQRLAVYRAAYALVTSNCFSVSGGDGHFAWCMRMLERPDVREALGL